MAAKYGCDPSKIYYAPPGSNLKEEQNKMNAAGMIVLVLGEGEYTNGGKDLVLDKPTKIIGQGRGMTTLVGFGLKIKGNKSDGIVEINNLKIKGAGGWNGLHADDGMKV